MKTRTPFFWTGVAAFAVAAPAARAHGAPPALTEAATPWWLLWNPDPLILFNLLALFGLYAFGLQRMMRQRGAEAPVRPRQVMAFLAGLGFVALALLSPVDVLADELQWMHMVQHMVLMNVAAPLFVFGAPARVMLWTLSPAARQRIGRGKQAFQRRGIPRYLFWQPVGLWALYAVVLWTWHVPALYEAALGSRIVHDFQHLTFFAASCLFWRLLFDPIGRLFVTPAPAAFYLFLTSLHATVLGVFMALAPWLWYPAYAGRTEPWGVSALEDQQLAGYIMWMPACMIYVVVAALLLISELGKDDKVPGAQKIRTPASP